MLDEAPVFYSEKWKWWALSRCEDVRAAATDHETFLSFEGIDIDDTAKDQSGPGFLPDIDNPRHDQLRRIVQPHFLPRRIAKHEEHVREVIREFVSRLEGPRMRSTLPRSCPGLRRWRSSSTSSVCRPSRRRAVPTWSGGSTSSRTATPATTGSRRWPRPPRRGSATTSSTCSTSGDATPVEDLITHIVQAEIDGVPLADEDIVAASEVMGLMTILLFGSAETTSGLMSTFFKLVAENPDQRDDPAEESVADRRRRRGGGPLRHAAATGGPHHLPRGHRPGCDHPEGWAGRAGLRRREPRPSPVPEPRQVRRHPRRPAAPRLR